MVRLAITKVPKYPYFGGVRLFRYVTLKQICFWLMGRLTKHFVITVHRMRRHHPQVHQNLCTRLWVLAFDRGIHFWRHC